MSTRALAVASVTVIACVLLGGCTQQPRRYSLRGKVVSVDKANNQVLLDHEAIPGLMAAMTMPYNVKDSSLLNYLSPGDKVTADLVVSGQTAWLENVVVVQKAGAPPPVTGEFHMPQPGEQVPQFELVNQDGRRIHFAGYRGKAVLLTFVYTRCPMPDFCPLMTRDFADVEQVLAKDPALYSKTHLLSISFDPKNDTPKVLRAYAARYAQSGAPPFAHWEFASIPEAGLPPVLKFFGMFYQGQEGQIVHSLSTAVVTPDGKVFRWYHGNDWKPADAVRDLSDSLLAARTAP